MNPGVILVEKYKEEGKYLRNQKMIPLFVRNYKSFIKKKTKQKNQRNHRAEYPETNKPSWFWRLLLLLLLSRFSRIRLCATP